MGKGGIYAIKAVISHHSHRQTVDWPNLATCSFPNSVYFRLYMPFFLPGTLVL